MLIPKDCVHTNCKNIVYVFEHLLHQPLMCEKCVKNKEKINYE